MPCVYDFCYTHMSVLLATAGLHYRGLVWTPVLGQVPDAMPTSCMQSKHGFLWCSSASIRPSPPSLTHPLCTLACCTSLASLSISSTAVKLSNDDMVQLGRLQGLRELTLRFASPTNERVCISPLSRLTNLQQLVVQGVIPTTPRAAAVGGGGATGEAAAAAPNGGDLSLTFPRSLTSLVLEGHGRDGNANAQALLRQWMENVPAGNNLKELHMLNHPADDGCLLRGLDFSKLKQLCHFRVLMASPDAVSEWDKVALHACLLSLSHLEVIEVGTYCWELPIMLHWFFVDEGLRSVLDPLVKLKKLGCVDLSYLGSRGPGAPILLEELSCYATDPVLPEWMTATSCPQLQRLRLEADWFSVHSMQSVARLAQLTSLQLSTALSHMTDNYVTAWDDLGVLGTSLPQLHRLELINPTLESSLDRERDALAMPELSAFTQIKQLQLVCLMEPSEHLPEQSRSTDFLQGLSKLTQLEQLQLEGYSTITPAVVCCLAQSLPQLQLLEVGLCKHDELLTAAGVGGRAEVRWEVLHPGFVEVQDVCSIVRPKLQVKVGYGRQWLE